MEDMTRTLTKSAISASQALRKALKTCSGNADLHAAFSRRNTVRGLLVSSSHSFSIRTHRIEKIFI